jgi:hypothetical protein
LGLDVALRKLTLEIIVPLRELTAERHKSPDLKPIHGANYPKMGLIGA